MKKKGRRLISAILVVIMTASIVMQTGFTASAYEQQAANISAKEEIIGLDQGLPVYRETVETGAEPILPDTVRVIVGFPEAEDPAEQEIIDDSIDEVADGQTEEDVFIPEQPLKEVQQADYEWMEGAEHLYQYRYDQEIDVTQEMENECVFLENGTYVSYRTYGSLNGEPADWYACDAEGNLLGVIREISVSWESNDVFDPENAGVYGFTADADSFIDFELSIALPIAEVTVVEEAVEEAEIPVERTVDETVDVTAGGNNAEEPAVDEEEADESEEAESESADELNEFDELREQAIEDMNDIARSGITVMPMSAERANIYWNPSLDDIYDSATSTTVGKAGNDNNSGRTAMAPLYTWDAVKAEAAAHSNFVNIIVMTQIDVTNDPATSQIDSVVNGGRAMQFSQWNYYGGIVFVIHPEASLKLENLTIDCSQTSGGVAIHLADEILSTAPTPVMGTFTIGEGFYIVGGMIELELNHQIPERVTAPPIILETTAPADRYVLYLADMVANNVFEGCDMITTPGISGSDYLPYFSLDSRNTDEDWILVQSLNEAENISVTQVNTWEGVFINGVSGNDGNFGGNCRKPVKTFERAKEILANQVLEGHEWNIYICDTVSVTGTETWDLPAGMYGTDPKVLPCYNHVPRNMIDVKSGGNLTLKNITICYDQIINGWTDNNILYLSGGSTCTVGEGAVLTGEYAAGQANSTARGISFESKADIVGPINLTMNGGEIKWLYYGVWGSFNLRRVQTDTFNIMGNSKISNCINDGVNFSYTHSNGASDNSKRVNLTMTGGEITDNGGSGINGLRMGLYVTLDGGSITNNSSGMYLERSGTITILNGKIANNTARNTWGGGIYTNGTVVMSGGEISGNTAPLYGGGVYASLLDFSGGTISDNTVYSSDGVARGGGIHARTVMSGSAVLKNNKVISMTGEAYGGGVSGTLLMDGGTIKDNTSEFGTQAYLTGASELIGGTITGSGADTSTIFFAGETLATNPNNMWIGFDPVDMNITGKFYLNETYQYIRLYKDVPPADQVPGRWTINLNVTPEKFDVGSVLVRSSQAVTVTVGANSYNMAGATESLMDNYLTCFTGGIIPVEPNKTVMGVYNHMIILLGEGVYLDGTNGNDSNTGDGPSTAVKTWGEAVTKLKSKISAAEADASNPDGMSPYIYVCGKVTLGNNADQVIELDYDAPDLKSDKNSYRAEVRKFTPYTGVLFEVNTTTYQGNVTFGKMIFNGMPQNAMADDEDVYDITVPYGLGTGNPNKAELYLSDGFSMETVRGVKLEGNMRMVMEGNASLTTSRTSRVWTTQSAYVGIKANGNSSVLLEDDSVVAGVSSSSTTNNTLGIQSVDSATVSLSGSSAVKGARTGIQIGGSSKLRMTGESTCENNSTGISLTSLDTPDPASVIMQGSSVLDQNGTGINVSGFGIFAMQDYSSITESSDAIRLSGGNTTISMNDNSSIIGGTAAFQTGASNEILSNDSDLMTPLIGIYGNSSVTNCNTGISVRVEPSYNRTIIMMGRQGTTDAPIMSTMNTGIDTNAYSTTGGKVILQAQTRLSSTSTTKEKVICNTLEMHDSAVVYHNNSSGTAAPSIVTSSYLYMDEDTRIELDAPNAYPASGPIGVVNVKEGGEIKGNALIKNNSTSYDSGRAFSGINFSGNTAGKSLILDGNAKIQDAAGAGIILGYTSGVSSSLAYHCYGDMIVRGNAKITGSGTYGIYDRAPAKSAATKTGRIILGDNAEVIGNNTSGTIDVGAAIYISRMGTLQIAGTNIIDDEIYLENLANPIMLSSAVPSANRFLVGIGRAFLASKLVIPTGGITDALPYRDNFIESANFILGSTIESRVGDVNLWVSASSGDVYLAGDALAGDGTPNPGNDNNDGLTPGTPVRTFAKAKEILKTKPAGTNIVITSRVNILQNGGTETWSFDEGGYFTNDMGQTWKPLVQRHENMTDIMISTSRGNNSAITIEFKDITIDGNGQLVTNAAPMIVSAQYSTEIILGKNAVFQNNSREENSTIAWTLYQNSNSSDPNVIYAESGYVYMARNTSAAIVMNRGNGFRMEGGTIRGMNNYSAVSLTNISAYFNSGSICENTGQPGNSDIPSSGSLVAAIKDSTYQDLYLSDVEIYDNHMTTGTIVSVFNSDYNSPEGVVIEGNGSIRGNTVESADNSTTGTILSVRGGAKLGGDFQVSNNIIRASADAGEVNLEGTIVSIGMSQSNDYDLTENFTIRGNRIIAESADNQAKAAGRIVEYNNDDYGSHRLQMNGGLIADNIIEGDDVSASAGVYIGPGRADLNDGIIRGNKCIGDGSRGAGLFIQCYREPSKDGSIPAYPVTLRGTAIMNNEADEGAGIYMYGHEDPLYNPEWNWGDIERKVEIYYGSINHNKPAGYSGTPQGSESGIYIGGPNFWLRGSGSVIEDYIYLASNEFDTRITLSGLIYHTDRIYNVDVGPDFDLGNIVVKPDGNMVIDATSYLRNFDLGTNNYIIEKAEPNLVLMRYMFIDSVNGNDANSGIDPDNAKKTWAGATAENNGEGLALYISGPVHVTGTEYWTLPWNSMVSRYTGFDVGGASFEAHTGHLVDLRSGDNLTVDSVLMRGRRDQDTGLEGGEAMFKVGSGATLTLTENLRLRNNLNNQSGNSGKGGAIYIEGGSAKIDGSSFTGMSAAKGSDVYQAGQLTIAGNPQLGGEVYLAGSGTTDASSHKIDVEDNFSMSSGQTVRVNVENLFDTRHVVEYLSGHVPTEEEQEYFEIDSAVSALYMMHKRPGDEHILELWIKEVVYIDGVNGSNSNDGSAPLKAVETFHKAYELIANSNKGGVLMVVDTVTIPSGLSVTFKNTVAESVYYEGSESSPNNVVTVTGEVSMRRYVQPTAWNTLAPPLEPALYDKASNQHALIKIAGGEMTASRLYIDGGNREIDGAEEYAGPAVTSEEAMLIVDGGRLNATSSVFYRNSNASDDGKGSGIYILNDGVCRLSDVTLEDTYVTGEDSKGSAIYHAGRISGGLVLDRTFVTDGEIHLSGAEADASSRYITIERPGFMQAADDNYLSITLEDRYLGRKVVEYPNTYTPTAAEDIIIYILETDVQEYFTLGNRINAEYILELQAPRRVYIDGINGNDVNTGDVPIRSVKTLERAYELLEESGGGRLYVVNTVQIEEYTSLTDHQYTDGTNTYTITGGFVEIRRYIVPDAYQSDSEYKNDSASVGDHTGTMFEITGSGELHLNDLVVSGEKNPRDGSDIYGAGGNPMEDFSGNREAQAASIEVKNNGNLLLGEGSRLIDNKNSSAAKFGGAIENYGYIDFYYSALQGNEAVKGAGVYQGGMLSLIRGAEGLADQEIYLVTDYTDRVVNLSEPVYLGSDAWKTLDVDMDHAVSGRNVAVYDATAAAVLADEIAGYRIPASTLGYNLFLMEADPVTEPNTLEIYRPTVDISFTKVAAENTSQPLSGVKFKLYEYTCTDPTHDHGSASTLTNDVVDSTSIADGCWTPLQTGGTDNVYTSAPGTGVVNIGEVGQGLYMLVETETAAGYQLPVGQWMVTINGLAGDTGPGDYMLDFKAKTKSDLPPAVIRDLSGGTVSYKVVNTRSFQLPLAGGIPRILMIVGIALMAAALGRYYYKNRKRREEQP